MAIVVSGMSDRAGRHCPLLTVAPDSECKSIVFLTPFQVRRCSPGRYFLQSLGSEIRRKGSKSLGICVGNICCRRRELAAGRDFTATLIVRKFDCVFLLYNNQSRHPVPSLYQVLICCQLIANFFSSSVLTFASTHRIRPAYLMSSFLSDLCLSVPSDFHLQFTAVLSLAEICSLRFPQQPRQVYLERTFRAKCKLSL